MLLTSMTLDEILKYSDIPEDILKQLRLVVPDVTSLQLELKRKEHRIEVLEEQLYFARELIDEVVELTKPTFKYKETKTLVNNIERVIENSFFER